jgi:L-malate glycosyltransferase
VDTKLSPGFRGALSRWTARRAVRLLLLGHATLLRLLRFLGPPRRAVDRGRLEVLLTGTFHSDNWAAAHLRPLAASTRVARVRVVATFPLAPRDKVEVVRPPTWLTRAVGPVAARLLAFLWAAATTRPDVVGGFHLLVNGLVAQLGAALTGARSLYFCVGGPAEVAEGGIGGENRLFSRMETADAVVEQRLLAAVRSFDLVITMGEGAARFFRDRGGPAAIQVVPGGIDGTRFHPGPAPPARDLVLVGRLAPVKRIDVFLRAVARLAETIPGVTAAVAGDGPLRSELEALARELGLEGRVQFLGQSTAVEEELRQSRVFVLSSDSEGLPLSVMEAMMCGLPAVVSDVGDLADLVEEGVNGFRVARRDPAALADRLQSLLANPRRLEAFSAAALRTAARHEIEVAARRWDAILD